MYPTPLLFSFTGPAAESLHSSIDLFYVIANSVPPGSRNFVNVIKVAECKQFGLFLLSTMGHQSPGAPPLIVWTECKEEESLRQVAKATKDQKIGRLIFFCPQHVKFQQVQQVSQDNLDLTRFNQESWRKWSKPREHGTNLLSSNCHTKGTTLYDPSQSIQTLCLETHAWGVELKRPAAQLGPVGNHNSPPRQENINRCPRAPWFSCPSLVSWNGAVLWGWPFLSGIVQRETRAIVSSLLASLAFRLSFHWNATTLKS